MEKPVKILDNACIFFMRLNSSLERKGGCNIAPQSNSYFSFFDYVTALQLRIIMLCKPHKVTTTQIDVKKTQVRCTFE